jgi:hypothetical protein
MRRRINNHTLCSALSLSLIHAAAVSREQRSSFLSSEERRAGKMVLGMGTVKEKPWRRSESRSSEGERGAESCFDSRKSSSAGECASRGGIGRSIDHSILRQMRGRMGKGGRTHGGRDGRRAAAG